MRISIPKHHLSNCRFQNAVTLNLFGNMVIKEAMEISKEDLSLMNRKQQILLYPTLLPIVVCRPTLSYTENADDIWGDIEPQKQENSHHGKTAALFGGARP